MKQDLKKPLCLRKDKLKNDAIIKFEAFDKLLLNMSQLIEIVTVNDLNENELARFNSLLFMSSRDIRKVTGLLCSVIERNKKDNINLIDRFKRAGIRKEILK